MLNSNANSRFLVYNTMAMSKEYLRIPLDAPGGRECGVWYEKPLG